MTVDSRIIVVKDESVEMAIAEGLNILQADKDEVKIEIIHSGKRGFLGIGKKMAKVKLTLKDNKKTASQSEREGELTALKNEINAEITNDNSNNKIKRKEKYKEIIQLENGKIRLLKLYRGKYPVIKGDGNIKLYEDGQQTTDSVILTENSNLMYQEKDSPAGNEIIITVSDDKLKAYLEIRISTGKLYKAIILPGGSDDIDFIISTEVDKELPAEEITIEDVYWKLEGEKISRGIKVEEIEKAINNPGHRYLIAEGEPPVEGADAWIEYLYKNNKLREELEDPLKNIDYFSKNDILSVKKGEIIAIKHSLQKGKNGYNIYGEELPAPEYKDIEWRVGEGIKIVDNKAIATKPGRPVLERDHLIINEIYLVNGDVDIDVGNIKFNGDVFVIGNVCENFRIEAGGMIKIAGNVTQAILRAEGDIIVKGKIINSKVIAGGLNAFYQEFYNYLDNLINSFTELEIAIRQLKKHNSFKTDDLHKYGEKQIIQLLIDTKYTNVISIIKDLYSLFEENEANSEYILDNLKELVVILKEKIKITGLCTFKNTSELNNIKSSIEDTCNLLNKIGTNDSNIWTSYIQKSELKASGSVVTAEEGAYNSNIYAGNKVVFKGKPGLFRGGKIVANNDIYIKELGSPGGSKVEIQVPANCKISAQKVYSNVLIKIGDQTHKFNYDYGNITVYIDSAGKLQIV